MSDAIIASEADYTQASERMAATQTRLRKQAQEENWPSARLETTLVDALLPDYKAMTDPASPEAGRMARKEYMDDSSGDAVILDPAQYPQLTAIIANQTREMNRLNGVNYPPPPIIAVDGLADDQKTEMQFNKDAVLIDKDFLEQHRNDPTLAGGIAHELAHRYQRTDALLRIEVRANVLELDLTQQEKIIAKAYEAEADFGARRVTPPGMMSHFLKDLFMGDAAGIGYFMQSHPTIAMDEGVTEYIQLGNKERAQWKTQAAALPPTEREASFAIGVRLIDASNSDQTHPKMMERLRLQEAIDHNGLILTCNNVQLTENAAILNATDCGSKHVPLIIDGLPTGQKLSR